MSEQPDRKPIKIGVREHSGPPPGYRWTVEVLDTAYGEAMAFLTEAQYQHLSAQFRELASQDDPTHSLIIDIRAVEHFYELRDKGGILGKINVRVFFLVHKTPHLIVVLGVIKKENDGPTPMVDKVRIRYRRRYYLASLPSQHGRSEDL